MLIFLMICMRKATYLRAWTSHLVISCIALHTLNSYPHERSFPEWVMNSPGTSSGGVQDVVDGEAFTDSNAGE